MQLDVMSSLRWESLEDCGGRPIGQIKVGGEADAVAHVDESSFLIRQVRVFSLGFG
jgi:hypothetical protein